MPRNPCDSVAGVLVLDRLRPPFSLLPFPFAIVKPIVVLVQRDPGEIVAVVLVLEPLRPPFSMFQFPPSIIKPPELYILAAAAAAAAAGVAAVAGVGVGLHCNGRIDLEGLDAPDKGLDLEGRDAIER